MMEIKKKIKRISRWAGKGMRGGSPQHLILVIDKFNSMTLILKSLPNNIMETTDCLIELLCVNTAHCVGVFSYGVPPYLFPKRVCTSLNASLSHEM